MAVEDKVIAAVAVPAPQAAQANQFPVPVQVPDVGQANIPSVLERVTLVSKRQDALREIGADHELIATT